MMNLLFATGQLQSTACTDASGTATVCDTGLPTAAASGTQLQGFLSIVIGIFAVVAVLMIIISALNIIHAEGDTQKLAKARGAIIYSVVGLVIAISAEVIVGFVLGHF